jgi:hypothetical protein
MLSGNMYEFAVFHSIEFLVGIDGHLEQFFSSIASHQLPLNVVQLNFNEIVEEVSFCCVLAQSAVQDWQQ